MNWGMHGIFMSIFTDFIAFKSSLLKCNEKIYSLGSIRWVWIGLGIKKLIFKTSTEKIGSFNQRVSPCSWVMMECVSCKICWEGAEVLDSFNINRKTILGASCFVKFVWHHILLHGLCHLVQDTECKRYWTSIHVAWSLFWENIR